MKYEVCSHVWNYSRLCCYHLSAYFLHPPMEIDVTVTIFYSTDDEETSKVIEYFRGLKWPDRVAFRPWSIETRMLLRRAIGRNLCAKATESTWLHLSDIDYIYGPGCLDAIPAALSTASGPLAFPRRTLRSSSHAVGDAAIERVTAPGIYDIDPADFSIETNRRAIGGICLYRGDVAREKGYLNGSRRFMRPERVWKRTVEDVPFRKSLGTRGEAIDLPNLYRIRHSRRGRANHGVRL